MTLPKHPMKILTIIISLLVSLSSISPVAATTLLPITLEQLSTRAEVIIHASVVSNQVKTDEISGQTATFTEFEVIELIKGNISGNRHTIKQLGGHLASTNTTLRVPGVPKYQVGSEYVVFLPAESSLGFCSPLGLQQGSFNVSMIDGEPVISNGRSLAQQPANMITSSRSALAPLAVNNSRPSQAYLSDFINSVRAFNTP
jgi:hypothetical protein